MEQIICSWVIPNFNTKVCQWRRRLTKSSFNFCWLVGGKSFRNNSKVLHWWKRKWRGCLQRLQFKWPSWPILLRFQWSALVSVTSLTNIVSVTNLMFRFLWPTFIGLGFSGQLDSFPPRPSRLPLHIQPSLSAMYQVRSFVCVTRPRSDHSRDGRPAPRGTLPAGRAGEVPRPAPSRKMIKTAGKLRGKIKAQISHFSNIEETNMMEQYYNNEQCPIQPVIRICKRK